MLLEMHKPVFMQKGLTPKISFVPLVEEEIQQDNEEVDEQESKSENNTREEMLHDIKYTANNIGAGGVMARKLEEHRGSVKRMKNEDE